MTSENKKQHRSLLNVDKNILILLAILVAIFLLFSALNPAKFLSKTNFNSMAYQLPEFGLLCLGMTMAILTGGMNLSLLSSCALAGILGALVMSGEAAAANPGLFVAIGCVVMVLTAIAMGAINGFVVGVIGVPGMLATLGTMSLYEGISLVLTKGGSVSGFPDVYYAIGNTAFLGVPIPILFFILGIVGLYFLLERNTWGLQVYSIGTNPIAALFSGVRNRKMVFEVYMISGLFIGLAAIIMCSRYNSARYDYGSSYLMKSILAAVLGGIAIEGGKGKVAGVVLSVMILQVLSSGLNLLNVKASVTNIIIGILLILVLIINKISNEHEKKVMISKVKGRFMDNM